MLYESTNRLDSKFYSRNAPIVAKQLLGCCLIVQSGDNYLTGWIVETEAYLDRNDSACHAARGRTKSNSTMFGPAGLLYVYSIHAKYCMNVVTGKEGSAQAVLLRAIQPLHGIPEMIARTGRSDLRMLARGPGRLCQAFGVDRSWDGIDLTTSDRIWIAKPDAATKRRMKVATSVRIGVTSAHDLPLRYFVDTNRFVSGRSMDHSRRPDSQFTQPLS